ncbi:MAG: WD40 repeat domain-containing protein [Acidobacteriota bacterium]
MQIQRQICPACAAPLPGSTSESVKCEHCGSQLRLKKDTGQLFPVINPNVETAKPLRPPMSKAKKRTIVAGILFIVIAGILMAYIYNRYNWHRVINSVAWSPDGQRIVSVHGQGFGIGGGTLRVWDATNGKSLKVITNKNVLMWQVIFSPDGKYLATGEHDGAIEIWDAQNLEPVQRFQAGGSFVDNLVWSPDSKQIAEGDANGTLWVWDVANGRKLYSQGVHTDRLEILAWSPDGKYIATGGWDGLIRVVDAATGQMLMEFKDKSYLNSVAWTADSKYLAAGGLGNMVHIIDVAKATEVFKLEGHKNSIRMVSWSPDGKWIASLAQDDTVRIWDAVTGKAVQVLDNGGYNQNMMWSPDGKYLASGGWGVLRIWETANWTMQQVQVFDRSNDVRIAGWSADNRQALVVGKYDEIIKILEVANQHELASMQVSVGEAIRRVLF